MIFGSVPDDALPDLYRDARALLFTPEEDFGITPLESQATGRPGHHRRPLDPAVHGRALPR